MISLAWVVLALGKDTYHGLLEINASLDSTTQLLLHANIA